jgi:UDP-2,3-diacylglucosamine hydrolase
MRITAISDVHIKQPHDAADSLLCRFLDHPLVQQSDYVVLLGDIFDLMCGPHQAYLSDYAHIFERLEKLMVAGKKVLFFEGNHDVHLQQLFNQDQREVTLQAAQYPVVETIAGKTYYFSHGDEHEVDNHSYQRYKKWILSPPLRFIANYVMPYWLLNFLGERASKVSRKKGSRVFNFERVKERFRVGVKTTTQGKYDFVLGGHSHVQDIFTFGNLPTIYINNGYALKTKTFIHIFNHHVNFENL